MDDKKQYFNERETGEAVNMRSFVQPVSSLEVRLLAKQKCKYVIDADIIDVLIADLLLDVNKEDGDQNKTRDNALKIFKYEEEDNFYVVNVASVLRMNLIVSFVSAGVSFRQTKLIYESVKDETQIGVLGSINDGDVSAHCRIVCAVNLQCLKLILKNSWAFTICMDAGNNAGTEYLDLRVRCYFKGDLQNLHLLAIPMRDRHTGAYQYDLIVKALDIIAPDWRHQLIGVSSDCASVMTGCIQGTCTRLQQECRSPIFRIWCGAHQLDLIVKKAFAELLDEKFLSVLSGVTGHLRRQQNLVREMNSLCPMFVSTRWISMGKVLKWLQNNRMRLLQHFQEKKPTCNPSMDWWLVILIIQPLVQRIEKTFLGLQGMNTLVCEQRQQFRKLQQDLMTRCNIKGPMTLEERQEKLNSSTSTDPNNFSTSTDPKFFVQGDYYTDQEKSREEIDEVGGFVQREMDSLQGSINVDAHNRIVSTIAVFALQVVDGLSKVVAERDLGNESARDELPPVLPVHLCNMDARDFNFALQQQRLRLRQKFTEAEVEDIDTEFRSLRLAFREESGLKQSLEENEGKAKLASFVECWSPLGNKYAKLKQYCGGIASVMPGTSSVESDFSLINWTKDPHSQSLTDFSLESILHAKQYSRIQALVD